MPVTRVVRHVSETISDRIDLMTQVRTETGLALDDTDGNVGEFAIYNGGWGDGEVQLVGQQAQNDTQTDTGSIIYTVPPYFTSAAALGVRVRAQYDESAGGTIGTKTMTLQVYKVDDDGTPALDLIIEGVQTLTNAMADYDLTLNTVAPDVDPGDRLSCLIRAIIQETIGDDVVQAVIGAIEFRLTGTRRHRT